MHARWPGRAPLAGALAIFAPIAGSLALAPLACAPLATSVVTPPPAASAAAVVDGCEADRELLTRVRAALAAGRTGRALALLDDPAPACDAPSPRLALRALTLAQLARFDDARAALARLRAGESAEADAAGREASALLAELAPQRGTEADARRLLAEAQAAPGCPAAQFAAAWQAWHPGPRALLGQARCAQLAGDEIEARRLEHRAASELEMFTQKPLELGFRPAVWWAHTAWSPDEGRLAYLSEGELTVISTRTWREELRLTTDRGSRDAVEFLPRGLMVSLAGDGAPARLWSTTSGEPIASLDAADSHAPGAFTTTRDRSLFLLPILATATPAAGDDEPPSGVQWLSLWDVATRATRAVVKPSRGEEAGLLARVVESPDGKLLAVQWSNDEIAVVAVATGAVEARLQGSYTLQASLTFSPDSRLLGFRLSEKGYALWDVTTRRQKTLSSPGCEYPEGLTFSSTGRLAATGTSHYTVCLWDVARGSLHAKLSSESKHARPMEDEGFLLPARFFADDRGLVASSGFHEELWDVSRRALLPLASNGTPFHLLEATTDRVWLADQEGHLVEVGRDLRPLALTAEGLQPGIMTLAGGGLQLSTDQGTVYDLHTGKSYPLDGYRQPMGRLEVDPSHRFAFAPAALGAWELSSGRSLTRPRALRLAPQQVAVDASQATVHAAFDGWLASWRPLSSAPPTLRPLPDRVLALHASGGQIAVVREGESGLVWQSLQPELPPQALCQGPRGAGHVAVSSDGRTVAWIAQNKLQLCPVDGSTARTVEDLLQPRRVQALPGDRGFVVEWQSSVALVSTTGTWQPLSKRSEGRVMETTVSLSGKVVVRRSDSLAVGEVSDEQAPLIRLPVACGDDIRAMALSPDGRQLVASLGKGGVTSFSSETGTALWTSRTVREAREILHAGGWIVAEGPQSVSVLSAHDGRELGQLALGSDGAGLLRRPDRVTLLGKGEPSITRCSVGPWVLPSAVCLDRFVRP